MRYLLSLLLSYLLATPVFAIYDLATINLTPNADGSTTFCFQLDTSQPAMYLAVTTNYQDFLFFSPELSLSLWQPPTPPPAFLQKSVKPACYGPFSKEHLQDVKLFAGVGNSFQEVIDRQQYLQIFDGFPTLTKEEKPWTVMVYMVGSTLEREKSITKGNASKDILEMLAGTRATLPNQVNVVLATGGSSREGWNTVKRSLVRGGQLYVLQDLGKQLMSEPQTLTDFVSWAKDNFPAQHYALILWNHGGGTQGYGQDTSQSLNAKMMSLDQLHQAYQTIREQFGQPLDLVVYDACVMASIEVAEITATLTDAMAGSVEVEPQYGLDYSYLFSHLNQAPPADGLTLGKIAKDGYIQYSQAQKSGNSFREVPITYSVFDLTLLPAFRDTLKQFATEFDQVLHSDFLSYEMLSRGIIRAPGYPLAKTGRILNSLSGKTSGTDAIRIDLYNVLQTVSPDYPNLKVPSDQLQSLLDQLVVSYEGNLQDRIQADDAVIAKAGRVSLDITINYDNDGKTIEPTYLSVLPEAYRLLYQDLIYYDQRRRGDTSTPEGNFVSTDCPLGMTCAEAKWWELPASEVLGVAGYYGQLSGEVTNLYLVKSLYRYHPLESDLDIGVDGHQACQYQLCVNETTCEELTVTEQNDQLLADISLNDSPAILTFCQGENDLWSACSVVSQTQGIWGRADILYPGDSLTPTTLHFQADELTSQQGNSLAVGEEPVTLKTSCDTYTATVVASYYGANQQPQFETICNKGDCVCGEGDQDASCQATGFQFKAGVRLKVE